MASLEQQFTMAMVENYQRAKDEAKYNATKFLQMVGKYGGQVTAKMLINAPEPSAGYTLLHLRERIDLAVEAVVLEDSRWHPLFTEDELNRAKKRLRQYGYTARASAAPGSKRAA